MRLLRKHLGIPYGIFLGLFVVLPLIIVTYYAFTNGQGQPTMENFLDFFSNPKTLGTLLYSLMVSAVTTFFCLLIAYPTAYILSKGSFSGHAFILMLVIMPMWINFTLRLTALKEVLDFVEGNLALHPFMNTIIGQVYDFLPFMILPIYNSMEKMDGALLEAARDLGASQISVIIRVMLPLTAPGIISGITMVLLPAMTNYVVLDMLYNSTFIMGSLIGSYFSSYDWHNGSMVSATLLLFIVIVSWISSRFAEAKQEKEGGNVI
ncbi:MAG: ABC transporter permease [Lachnospiraceae bacterium]|nr:ABC transporter permease [Lachnospiraceae bacterium]